MASSQRRSNLNYNLVAAKISKQLIGDDRGIKSPVFEVFSPSRRFSKD